MTGVNPLVAADGRPWRESHSLGWRRMLRSYDRLAVRLVERRPASAVRLLGGIGAWANAAGLVAPRTSLVAAVFPWLTPRQTRQVARQAAALRFRNRTAIAVLHARGPAALASWLAPGHDAPPPVLQASKAGPGAVLLAFHIGAEFGITAALHRWGVEPVPLRNWSILDVDDRARALRQAVDDVRRGKPVLAIVDGPGGADSAPVVALGRQIVLRRAPFMLARVTGAPLVPSVAQWTPDGRIRTRLGPPLDIDRRGPAGDVEAQMAAMAASWLERHLTACPEDAWPYTIRNLAGAPRK